MRTLLSLLLCSLLTAVQAGSLLLGQQGVVAASSTAWTPAQLGSSVVYAWAEGSSLVSADGTAINPWTDLSGNSRNWTQSTSSKQPTEQTVGSVRVARFDSVDDGMTGAVSVSTNNFTVVACYRYATTSSAYRRALSGGVNWLVGPYVGFYWYYDGRGYPTAGPAPTTNFVVHSVSQFASSTPDSSYWVNGALIGSLTHAGATESIPPTTINLAAEGLVKEALNGDIYGIIVLAGVDTTNRQKCEGYLAWKVGIQSSLDASHPYKSSPP